MHGEIVIVMTTVGTACAVLFFPSVTPSDNELYTSFFLFCKPLQAPTKGLPCNHGPYYLVLHSFL